MWKRHFKNNIGVRTLFEDPLTFRVPPLPPSERTYFLNGPRWEFEDIL